MSTLLKPAATTATTKTWKGMNTREKMFFAAKLGIMFASFGWVYGNTLAPDEVKPLN
jgi:hypothetical protein